MSTRAVPPIRKRSSNWAGTRPRPVGAMWWRGWDLNPRPSGYEPDELPDCSTPRRRRAVYTAQNGPTRPTPLRWSVQWAVVGVATRDRPWRRAAGAVTTGWPPLVGVARPVLVA